ncbi:MAG TPA: electron transfer flavoprotein-ubiquinone oxidoreductase [Candidatus Dormibacteraeota bacterium]|jgi:electron-transferring-flavoprotein dehydrogenase|nr:electron transfer flavoprotein-ubiquinone oxidoreductase [Candidatus Dormibacteraeota bacterium]
MSAQREQLEADVLIVGAGPAGLACALHLANLIKAHNASGAKPELSAENIYVLEKGREIGAHQLSGAIMNPKALAELVPDFEKSAPLDTPVTDSAALFFTEKSSFRFPITPPPFMNKGNYVVSLNKIVKWLGEKVEAAGVNVFKEFGGAQLIYEHDGIGGVITEDKGVDKNGKQKDNYQPGYELRAKVTVLAEGTRGSLTKELVAKKKFDNINPQSYGIGIKELWDVQPGKIQPGYVAHTLGWPVPSSMYGGGWIYGLSNNRVSIGLVIALEYADPRFDPHATFQEWKTNPFVANILDGGKLVRYGAKSLPYGGWYAMPRNYFDGGLIVGDSGSFLDSQKLKGIHLAIKSGMLAAETIFEALKAGDTSAKTLSVYQSKIEQSYIKKELWKVRNFHQGFAHGQFSGFINTAFQQITGGRGLVDPMHAHAGHEAYKKIKGAPAPPRFVGDGKLTFDRLTDVYHSGTRHEEDQPCHLHIADLNVCATKCVEEYGNPCQFFCPAAVYEMVKDGAGQKLKINFANCVHCKTCDIADPYQIITWVVPEGGGGPNYEGM